MNRYRTGPDFDRADYYDCGDSEALCHETPEEAIADHVLTRYDSKVGAVTVTAYARAEFSDDVFRGVALRAADMFSEEFDEAYNPQGEQGLPRETVKALADQFLNAMRDAVRGVSIWRCEECGTRDYSPEDVAKIVAEYGSEE